MDGLNGLLGGILGGQNNLAGVPIREEKPEMAYKPCLNFLQKFKNRNVLVTGATGGVGAKVAQLLMENEVGHLALFCRDRDAIDQKVEAALKGIDGDRYCIEMLDFSEPQRVEQKFTKVLMNHFHGRIDCLILCHGTVIEKGLIGCKIPEFDQSMLVNVRSMVHMISLAIPFLKVNPQSSVSVLTSSQGLSPDPMSTVMSMSAAMVHQLIKCSALEGAYHGVRVNGVAAGVLNTKARTKKDGLTMNLTKEENEKYLKHATQDVPLLNKLPEPIDIAHHLLFLASEDASFTNGEILTVDGGQSLTTCRYDDYSTFVKREYA